MLFIAFFRKCNIYLNTQDAKNDEKCTTDQYDIANRSQ